MPSPSRHATHITSLHAALRIVLAVLLAACAPLAPSPPAATTDASAVMAAQRVAGFDEAPYRAARARGETVLNIDPQASLITITVRRGGKLARLGHDHIVASRTLAGFVAPGLGRADLHFRLDQLSIDEAHLRGAAGFDTQPSADAIAGTRRNMLDKVLDAERYPQVLLRVTQATQATQAKQAGPDAPLMLAITLHGVTREMPLAAALERDAAGRRLVASGTLELKQSDFGIVPFAVLGGALAVQDRMELAFRIVAVAATGVAGLD